MDISCTFATSLNTPDHIVLAERLGYRRAWCYDSPALYPDVWMTLARAAERTHRIQLGPGVLVPSLRHVLVNAVAIATLVALAPARVMVGVGAGFTGRLALGQRPLRWRDSPPISVPYGHCCGGTRQTGRGRDPHAASRWLCACPTD